MEPELTVAIVFFFFYLVFIFFKNNKHGLPTNWPLVGILPTVLLNLNCLPEKLAELLERGKGTIQIHGGFFLPNLNAIATSDPANVKHITSTNFFNYPKGSESAEVHDAFGVSVFNLDLEEWKYYRKIANAYFSHRQTNQFMAKVIRGNIKQGLIPVLDLVSRQDIILDLEELFKRIVFDFACKMSTGYNPKTLSTDLPENNAYIEAMDEALEAVIFRKLMPGYLWKLQRWLGVGKEKKLREAKQTLRDVVDKYISMRREKLSKRVDGKKEDEEGFDLLQCFLTEHEVLGSVIHPEETIRDSVLAFIFAARDTTTATLTWFFYLLAKNPSVETKIREEISQNFTESCEIESVIEEDVINKLVYLHAALSETLRLYPPVPVLHRICLQHDILPTGHRVNPKTNLLLSAHSTGRMKWIWGEDCLEFKPERWIGETAAGRIIKYQPSTKFLAFSGGPRICPGKKMAFKIMKAIAVTVVYNYHVQVLDSHGIPEESRFLRLKHGLKAKVIKSRC